MKNKITDLNNHLFAQLERLGDEDMSSDSLEIEIKRSQAIANIARNIVDTSRITLEAMKLMERSGHDISRTGEKLLSE